MHGRSRTLTIIIAILAVAVMITEVIFSFYDIRNYRLMRTDFDVDVYQFYSEKNPTLVITGSRLMSWGNYCITFELLDKSNIALRETCGETYKKWFVETFYSNDSRQHFYEILNCPKGEHVLKINISKDSFSKTYHLPFWITAKQ